MLSISHIVTSDHRSDAIIIDLLNLRVFTLILDTVHYGMTNYRNGPQRRARRLTTMDRNEGVYCHDIATVGLWLGL